MRALYLEWDTVCCSCLPSDAWPFPQKYLLKNVLVLRYSPYTRAVTQAIRSGKLGQLVNAQHIEPVGHWHFAHSYVRGNWSKERESSFSLMTKSCQYVQCWFVLQKNAVRLINPIIAQRYRHHVSLALSRHSCPRLIIWWFTAFPQVREASRSRRCYALPGLRIRKTVSVQREEG